MLARCCMPPDSSRGILLLEPGQADFAQQAAGCAARYGFGSSFLISKGNLMFCSQLAPGQQIRVLEDHPDLRTRPRHRRAVEHDLAARQIVQAGHRPEQRALAAAGRAEDADELAFANSMERSSSACTAPGLRLVVLGRMIDRHQDRRRAIVRARGAVLGGGGRRGVVDVGQVELPAVWHHDRRLAGGRAASDIWPLDAAACAARTVPSAVAPDDRGFCGARGRVSRGRDGSGRVEESRSRGVEKKRRAPPLAPVMLSHREASRSRSPRTPRSFTPFRMTTSRRGLLLDSSTPTAWRVALHAPIIHPIGAGDANG